MTRKAEFYIGGHAIEHAPAWHSPGGLVTPLSPRFKNKRVPPDRGALGESRETYEQRKDAAWPIIRKGGRP
jgi:hypothetical protein